MIWMISWKVSLDNIHDENSRVQLQLLTTLVKLFLKGAGPAGLLTGYPGQSKPRPEGHRIHLLENVEHRPCSC